MACLSENTHGWLCWGIHIVSLRGWSATHTQKTEKNLAGFIFEIAVSIISLVNCHACQVLRELDVPSPVWVAFLIVIWLVSLLCSSYWKTMCVVGSGSQCSVFFFTETYSMTELCLGTSTCLVKSPQNGECQIIWEKYKFDMGSKFWKYSYIYIYICVHFCWILLQTTIPLLT